MPVWLQFGAGLLAAAAVLTAIGVIGRAVVVGVRFFRKFSQFLDDLIGEPARPGFPEGRPGLFDRLASIEAKQAAVVATLAALEARTAAVEAQLHPNGGDSLRDRIDRLTGQHVTTDE